MPLIILSAALIFAAYPTIGTMMAVWVLAASQLSLLIWQIRKRQVSGVGGFLFMSFLFFAVRPIYMIIENDYGLTRELFKIRMDLTDAGMPCGGHRWDRCVSRSAPTLHRASIAFGLDAVVARLRLTKRKPWSAEKSATA